MRRQHEWVRGMVARLDGRLQSAGLGRSLSCRNLYGLVGYGQRVPNHNARIITSASGSRRTMVSAAELALLSLRLRADSEGRLEDGYEAINAALTGLQLRKTRSDVSTVLVLVSDEDRDETIRGRFITRSFIKQKLLNDKVSLFVVADNRFTVASQPALGLTNGRRALLERPSCAIAPSGSRVLIGWGFATQPATM